jgi:hypothetical protein
VGRKEVRYVGRRDIVAEKGVSDARAVGGSER